MDAADLSRVYAFFLQAFDSFGVGFPAAECANVEGGAGQDDFQGGVVYFGIVGEQGNGRFRRNLQLSKGFLRPEGEQLVGVGEAVVAAKGAARVDDDGAEAERFCHAGEGDGDVYAADHDECRRGAELFDEEFEVV